MKRSPVLISSTVIGSSTVTMTYEHGAFVLRARNGPWHGLRLRSYSRRLTELRRADLCKNLREDVFCRNVTWVRDTSRAMTKMPSDIELTEDRLVEAIMECDIRPSQLRVSTVKLKLVGRRILHSHLVPSPLPGMAVILDPYMEPGTWVVE